MTQRQQGIILIIFSSLSFALMNVFVRLSGDLPFYQKSLFRNLVSLVFVVVLLEKNRKNNTSDGLIAETKKLNSRNKLHLFYRSLFGTIGVCCNYYAVDNMPLSDASMLNKMSPFYILLFSYWLLKEKLTVVQLGSVILAFIGSIFVIKPTGNFSDFFPSLVGLLGGLGAGAAYTAVRFLGNDKVNPTIIIYGFSLFSTIAMIVLIVILGYSPMTFYQVGMLLLAGLCATGGQYGITYAYSKAPAREISVYDYSQIPFSAILSMILFQQSADMYSLLGYFIIFLAALVSFLYGNKKEAS